MKLFRFARAAIAGAGIVLSASVGAEPGITETTITLGQSAAFSGSLAALGEEYKAGANLYFESINARGGVLGRKIKLVSLDDGYDPARATANTTELLEKHDVFVLFGYLGTGITQAILPMASAAKVPVFAPYTGADVFRDNSNRYLFHIRASYGEETDKIVEQLTSVGVNRIAVVYQSDTFGKAGLQSAEQALARRGLKPAAVGAIDSATLEAKSAVETISKADPMAIVMVTAGKSSVAFVREYIKTGQRAQFFTLSVVSSRALVAELGDQAHGIAMSQVLPSPWQASYPLVREYQQLAGKGNNKQYSYVALEGFAAAKVLVEALKRAGAKPTREKVIAALEGMSEYDIGGFNIGFSPRNRNGSHFVDLTIIGKNGYFVH